MSPLQIEILFWYYTRPGDWIEGGQKSFVDELLDEGLLEACDDDKTHINWMLSKRGHAYVNRLLEIPLPHLVEVWVFPGDE